MKELDELKRRLEALERENARLRASPSMTARDITTLVGMYKGHPVLQFDGPFRPFSIGLKKAWIILQKLDEVRFFVQNNKHMISGIGVAEEEPKYKLTQVRDPKPAADEPPYDDQQQFKEDDIPF